MANTWVVSNMCSAFTGFSMTFELLTISFLAREMIAPLVEEIENYSLFCSHTGCVGVFGLYTSAIIGFSIDQITSSSCAPQPFVLAVFSFTLVATSYAFLIFLIAFCAPMCTRRTVAVDPIPPRPSGGLNSHEISILPLTTVMDCATECATECAICLSTCSGIVRQLPCGHRFHPQCIDQWLTLKNSCALCRKPPVKINPKCQT